jgi:hypothetical protein
MHPPAFSDRGDAPTAFERELVDQFSDQEARHVRQLWLLIAKRIGCDAMCVVLDEIGGMTNLSAPSRRNFFRDLYRDAQRETIAEKLGDGLRVVDVAADLGVPPIFVSRVKRRIRQNRQAWNQAQTTRKAANGDTR